MFLLWRSVVAAMALGLAISPATAQPPPTDELVEMIQAIAPATVRARTGGERPAEKAVAIGRRDGQLVITTMYALWSHQWEDPPEGTVAVMRTRASSSSGGPEPADLDYARRTGVRLFIVGEWADPPPIWELEREGEGVRVRQFDGQGAPGAWRTASE